MTARIARLDGPAEEAAVQRMFPPGAPDVAIGALSIARSTITQRSGDTARQSDEPEHEVRWEVYARIAGDESPAVLVFGDLIVMDSSWFVGATSVAVLYFRDRAAVPPKSEENELKLTATFGPWLTHALYDMAAGSARRLIAGSPECEVTIPYVTPDPTLSDATPGSST